MVRWKKRGAAILGTALVTASLTTAGIAAAPSASAAVATSPGAFNAVTPVRLLDTRTGVGAAARAVPGGASVSFQVGGLGGVPESASAVVLNVTVTRPVGAGHITAYPAGGDVPTASSLNFSPNLTIANAVTVKLGEGEGNRGKVTLANGSAQSVQLVADVAGWYVGGEATAAGTFTAMAPTRLLDTREGLGAGGARAQVPGRGSITFDVGGAVPGIPDDASAAVLNVTVTRGTAPGHVTAYPAGGAAPTASNLNFVARQTIANAVTVKLGQNGKVTLVNGSASPVDLIVDVAGWFVPGQASVSGAFVPLAPLRLLDTRSEYWEGSFGDDWYYMAVPGGWDVWVDVEGSLELPEYTASAVVLNVTATRGEGNGHITAYDGESEQIPTASNINFFRNQTIPNQVTVELGDYGDIGLYNGSAQSVHLVADVAGFYRN